MVALPPLITPADSPTTHPSAPAPIGHPDRANRRTWQWLPVSFVETPFPVVLTEGPCRPHRRDPTVVTADPAAVHRRTLALVRHYRNAGLPAVGAPLAVSGYG
jgi:hypothetical protein